MWSILRDRIHLAIGSSLLALSMSILLQTDFNNYLFLLIFTTILSVYLINEKSDTAEDIVNKNRETEDVVCSFYTGLFLLIFSLFFSLLIGIGMFLTVLLFYLVFTLYSFGYIPLTSKYTRLKEILLIKNITISFAISFLITSTVAYYNGFYDTTIILFFMFLFFRIMVGSIIPDIRDIEGDKKAEVHTLPVVYDVKKTKIILFLLNTAATLVYFIGPVLGILPGLSYVPGLVNIISYLIIFSVDKDNAKFLSYISDLNDTFVFFLLTVLSVVI